MSETFNLILNEKKGYISETYGEDNDIFTLDYILEKEMIELGNVDIPMYLSEQSFIDLDEYSVSTDSFSKMVNKEYIRWLNINRLEQGVESLELFKEDCFFRNIQNNSFGIIEDIKEVVSDYLGEDTGNIKCFWLTKKEISEKKIEDIKEYPLPSKEYICISDMDEEGILIAFK